jgi:23S rRNA (pseudouridine1915-N3)-methyltransferase
MTDSAPALVLCWPGKTTAGYARIGIEEYLGRIRRFRSCKCLVVPEEPPTKQYSDAHRLERQGKEILKRLDAIRPRFLVVVDPRGKAMDSQEFADLLRRQCYDDARTLAFVVGGPDGVASGVRGQADLLLGLSRMTLPHDMARVFLTEQIYRGFTMIHGLPYSR